MEAMKTLFPTMALSMEKELAGFLEDFCVDKGYEKATDSESSWEGFL